LEWGAGSVTLETTDTGPYRHQISMFFTRGAARQYRKYWNWYIATFLSGSDSAGVFHAESCPYYLLQGKEVAGGVFGKDYGMSTSLDRRDMYLAYLSGASFVEHETWPWAYCQYQGGTNSSVYELSPHGEVMKEWHAYTRRHPDRGISYTPVALAIPFDQGYPQWGGSPFSYFPEMRGDTMIDAFMYTLAPFANRAGAMAPYGEVAKIPGDEGCLVNSPFGDIYDVLVLDPPSGPARLQVLDDYKVVVLLGPYAFDRKIVGRLKDYVAGGGTLVINSEQLNDLFRENFAGLLRSGKKAAVKGTVRNKLNGAEIKITEPYDYATVEMRGARILWEDESGGVLAAVNRYGKGHVLTTMVDWMVPHGNVREDGEKGEPSAWLQSLWKGREMPFVKLLMEAIVGEVLPVKIKGDIEYGVNKCKDGWLVYLINNKGVTKWTDKREILDDQAIAKVSLNCGKIGKVEKVTELRSDKDIPYDHGKRQFEIAVGPGNIKIILISTKAE